MFFETCLRTFFWIFCKKNFLDKFLTFNFCWKQKIKKKSQQIQTNNSFQKKVENLKKKKKAQQNCK